MIADLAVNLNRILSLGLQMIGRKAFIDLLMEEGQLPGMNVNRLTNKAVYLLCWLKRYQGSLFPGWKMPQIGCFLFMGNCKSENEALFFRFLARLPVDVVLFHPNRNNSCCLEDPKLYEINYTESLVVEHFPRENGSVQVGTVAYHAERELDSLMYQDSGIYRNQQYQKANSLSLQTMYEEISLLWKEEVKYRPNFSTVQDTVNIPVIFAKVSGVKDGQLLPYWNSIRNLVTEDTLLIRKAPYLSSTDVNPMRSHSVEFLKNGKLQRERIKANRDYSYGVLREEVQDHMLDKLQLLIDRRLIKGTFENGTEYTIVAVVLNLKKELVRMIQKFDFTKKNPKLIYINTGEKAISLEDSILAAYLNLIGFDVLFFVPTGYQSVENHFNGKLMEEHQIGTYLYDLTVPDFGKLPSATRPTWRDKIFKRGT
jgi:hypothetical protein